MKNKMLKGIAVAVITTLVIACQPKKDDAAAAPVVDKEAVKAELQTMESAFADAMNARKADGIVYYADDATSYSQNKPPLVGKDAIYKSVKEEIDGMEAGAKISYTGNEVYPSNDGNQAVELGSYKVVDSTGTTKSTGNYMALFEKRDGKYICIRDMGASDMPKKKEKK
ncbi:nuclear transport factor 2 family protein [Flavobacterium sp.]|uniref:YybH family protein n=1 Tax=Flavobacterium sp. TaxID=239 RepID=UPI0025D2E1D4|nr:nuclear transport factor 2 family protein [Flavobacterium sp.]